MNKTAAATKFRRSSRTAREAPGRKNKLMNEVDVCTERDANDAEENEAATKIQKRVREQSRAPVEKNKLMNEGVCTGREVDNAEQRKRTRGPPSTTRVEKGNQRVSKRPRPYATAVVAPSGFAGVLGGRAKLPAPTGLGRGGRVSKQRGHRARSPKIEWVRYEKALGEQIETENSRTQR